MQNSSLNSPEYLDSQEQLFAHLPESLKTVFRARYLDLRQTALEKLSDAEVIDLRETAILLLREWKETDIWNGYNLTETILDNSAKIRARVLMELQHLPKNPATIREYFLTRDNWLKHAFNAWLLANPGQALELYRVNPQASPALLEWLKEEFQVVPGDPVIHRHVLSGRSQAALETAGISVPYHSLAEAYYADAMEQAAQMTKTNQVTKGILGEGSWIYNPANFVPDDEGKTPAKFSYLKDEKYTGSRLRIPPEQVPNMPVQRAFALRSAYRKELYEQGLYAVEVYGVFMPAKDLIERFHPLYKKTTA